MAKDNPKLSVLVPSRERAEALKFSLDSLGLERNNIEVLVWVDDDDPKLKEYQTLFGKNKHIKLFIKPRVSYRGFHIMQKFLAEQASGGWLYLWNDDAYMDSVEWYDQFIEYASLSNPKDEPVVYNNWGQGSPKNFFPIVSIKYFKLLGHTAENCICDLWVRDVAYGAHIQRTIFGIRPRHRKFGLDNDKLGDLRDNTYNDIQALYNKSHYLGSMSRGAFEGKANDLAKIVDWIKSNPDRSLRVGFVGLGKLGFPVAMAIESRGKNVVGYDINPDVRQSVIERRISFNEEGSGSLLKRSTIDMVNSIEEVVKKTNLIFCAVQTPHDQRFEGNKLIKDDPVDFDYTHLKLAIKEIVKAADKLKDKTTLVLNSTCLPGTYEKEIKPLLSPKVNYVYNPLFIAMGTVISDFLDPDFILIGNNNEDITPLTNFYKMIIGKEKTFVTDIKTAEGIKVLYNSYLTSKIVFANIYGEMAHKLGMNADDIYKAFSLATNRILSPRYLKAGVGTGGGCHPRDNIALSYLAKKSKISFNIFEQLTSAREKHMEWLADLGKKEAKSSGLPLIILGKAFKPESNIQTGSPAILLANILTSKKAKLSHFEFDYPEKLPKAVYIIATQHDNYTKIKFPKGSIIIDPFRYISQDNDIKVISIGGKNEKLTYLH